MNAIRRLCMHQRNANAFQEAERDKALFIIAKPIVLERECRASKDFLRIDKIKAVLLEIVSSLGFAPRKPHVDSVYTNRMFVKAECGICLTRFSPRYFHAERVSRTARITGWVVDFARPLRPKAQLRGFPAKKRFRLNHLVRRGG